MEKTIRNGQFAARISTHGAELHSIQDAKGKEYLWQGDETTWTDHAPVLFPYIGRFTDGRYSYQGADYSMQIHGLAMYSEFTVTEESDSRITFALADNEETRKQYPFSFCFEVTYEWIGNRLEVLYRVKNTGTDPMYFAVGGHPGFCVPFEEGECFEDYQIEFSDSRKDADSGKQCGQKPKKVEFSEDCYVLPVQPSSRRYIANPLPLKHDLFDEDAIVMEDAGDTVTLRSRKSGKSITVHFPKMDYLGIWHWPKAAVPYVCLEPWSSLPSRKDIVEDLEKKEDMLKILAGEVYENRWSMELDV